MAVITKKREGLMYNILVCDDEKDIVSALRIYLESDGYNVFEAYNGHDALHTVETETVHLVLLDIMMPGMDGVQTIAKLRGFSNVPVIFLTAKSEETDMILGLSVGADDYITKPFNPVEVLARVRSNLRRYVQLGSLHQEADVLTLGGIELNDQAKEVMLDGTPVSLTKTEYEILKLLMEHPDKVLTPAEIYREVWKDAPLGTENIVAVHVRNLREKIEYDPANPRYLKTVWGHGYKMEKR